MRPSESASRPLGQSLSHGRLRHSRPAPRHRRTRTCRRSRPRYKGPQASSPPGSRPTMDTLLWYRGIIITRMYYSNYRCNIRMQHRVSAGVTDAATTENWQATGRWFNPTSRSVTCTGAAASLWCRCRCGSWSAESAIPARARSGRGAGGLRRKRSRGSNLSRRNSRDLNPTAPGPSQVRVDSDPGLSRVTAAACLQPAPVGSATEQQQRGTAVLYADRYSDRYSDRLVDVADVTRTDRYSD